MARKVGLERAQVIETAATLADPRDPEPLTLQALTNRAGRPKTIAVQLCGWLAGS